MMEVKGEAILSIPIFVLKKGGIKLYNKWLDSLSPEARKVFSSPIYKDDWFSLKEIMVEPTKKACELFLVNSKRGAWECGRYIAEYGLKGIYRVLIKLASPKVLLKKAGPIIASYYKPSSLEVVESDNFSAVIRIKEFPEMDEIIECRIGCLMERATEICGCFNVKVKITKSLTQNDPYTEYVVTWRKKL